MILKLFSKHKSSEEKSKTKEKIGKSVAAGSVLTGQAIGTKMVLENGILDMDQARRILKIKKKSYTPEDKKLFEKLSEAAKEKGIKIGGNSPIVGPAYFPSEDAILGLESGKGADMLSHELGHRHYFKEKDANVVGKAAHKIYEVGGSLVHGQIVPIASGIAAGTAAGKSKARKEVEGKKESFIGKHGAWAGPLITTAPMLISEAAASRHGIKTLKSLGASKEYLKDAKKGMAQAYSTYAGQAGLGAGVGIVAKEQSYRKEKRKIERKKKKD